MSLTSHVSLFRQTERRRSERLPFRETVYVCARRRGKSFREETLTISVSAHGALVPLSLNLSPGEEVLLMNPQTWDEREGRVVRLGNTKNGRTEVAIEFAVPAPEFWPVPVGRTSLPIPENAKAVASSAIAPTAAIPMQIAPYEWQGAVAEALRESRPEQLPSKVAVAERAIAARLRDANPPSLDERIALQESLQTLRRVLTSQEEAAEFWKKKETA